MKSLSRDFRSNYFSADARPALVVEPGESFRLGTASLLTLYPNGDIPPRYEAISLPVTGPVHVEGAGRGSVLRVTVERISLPTGKGVLMTLPGLGVMGGETREFRTRVVTYDDTYVYFNDKVRVPVRKMIGKLGTAPREPVWSSLPGPHGGNLDNNDIVEGAIIYLPVHVDGGFFYVGDLHAAQGDGEPFSGVESEGEVVLRVEVRDDVRVSNPVVVTPESLITNGAGKTIEEAVQIATREAIELLVSELALSHAEASMLCSIGCHIRLSQVMNPLMGAKVVIPRVFLPASSQWLLPEKRQG